MRTKEEEGCRAQSSCTMGEVRMFTCRRNEMVGHMDHTLVLKDSKKRMKLKDMERGLFSIPGEPFRTPQERQSARLPK